MSDLDRISLSNVLNGSPKMWAHVVTVYVITYIVLKVSAAASRQAGRQAGTSIGAGSRQARAQVQAADRRGHRCRQQTGAGTGAVYAVQAVHGS
jgi:hypothetical protein